MENERGRSLRRTIAAALSAVGLILSVLSLAADYLGLDLTPGFGMVQMFQLLVGITCLTVAIFLYVSDLRKDAPRSLQADIGIRLAATGLVFAYVSGLADLIRIGTHIAPNFERPYVGPLQLGGLVLSILIIVVGALLYYTSRGTRQTSSMEFILNGNNKSGQQSRPELTVDTSFGDSEPSSVQARRPLTGDH